MKRTRTLSRLSAPRSVLGAAAILLAAGTAWAQHHHHPRPTTWWERAAAAPASESATTSATTTAPTTAPPPATVGPTQHHGPPPQKGKIVEVSVVEIAGTQAYLEPGTRGGVRRTAGVVINGKTYKVVQATESFAVIELGEHPPHEKDKGRCTVVEDEEVAKPLPAPRPLETWNHAWSPEAPPADQQVPKFVPLGEANRSRKWDAQLSFMMGGTSPFSGQAGSSMGFIELGARVHAEPFSVPAALDFDGALRLWAAPDLSTRVGGSTRSVLWVRELLASYGAGNSWYAGLGRMKYAASTLGTLDGLRLQAPVGGGFFMSAFGGFLPNPLGGEISLDAQRFGVEARYNRPEASLRPEAALVISGSTFDGKPDERRVSAMFGLYPGHSRIGGHVEVSNFDSNNPWKANTIELTGAGVDQSIRIGNFEVGGRIDVLQPERSYYLASFLPSSWFCRTVPSSGTPPAAEPCDGNSSMRAIGSANIGLTLGKVSLGAGVTTTGDVTHGTTPRTIGAFATARVVRIGKVLRLEASGSASSGSYANMFNGSGGFGLTLFEEALDVSVYYRRAELQYAAFSGFLEQNGVGGMVVLFPASTMMFSVQGEGITGNDVNAMTLIASAVWRPRL